MPESLYYPRIVCEINLWLHVTLVYVQRIQLWPVKASFLSPMLSPRNQVLDGISPTCTNFGQLFMSAFVITVRKNLDDK